MSVKTDKLFRGRNILARDFRKPNDHLSADVTTLGTYSEACYYEQGIEPAIIWKKFEDVVNAIPSILNRNTNVTTPSIFKRAAAFTIAYIQCSPLDQPFELEGSPLSHITNHQNAIVAFEYSRQCLHGGSYILNGYGIKNKEVTLENKIAVSPHFYYDTIHAIAHTGQESFHFISLLYESLCYKANPGCCYPENL